MNKWRIVIAVLVLALAVGLATSFAGCASKPKAPEKVMSKEYKGAPDWVVKNCTAYWGEKKGEKKVCGVGSVGSTRNMSLARTAAEARGRAEIAFMLENKVKAMVKDYQATTTGGEEFGTTAADEQHIVSVSKQVTEMTLAGTELVDTWMSDNGTYYALIVYDAEKFKDAVSQMKTLSEALRKAIIDRADKAFQDMDNEIQTQKQSRPAEQQYIEQNQ